MTYRITKRFEFAAGHHLPHLPEGHKCRNPHGHNYVVTVALEAPDLDVDGFVLDYGNLSRVKAYLDQVCDHRDLNTLFDFATTAENLARHLHETFAAYYPGLLTEVIVSETPNTTASYRPAEQPADEQDQPVEQRLLTDPDYVRTLAREVFPPAVDDP